MKKYIFLIVCLASVFGILGTLFVNKTNVQTIDSDSKIPDGMKNYSQTVSNLNEGWANIRIGDSYRRSGEINRAIEAYKRAYDIDAGNRVYTGDILIRVYENLGRYDEAIVIIDDILHNQRLAEKGIKDFTEMRVRILAKAQQGATAS